MPETILSTGDIAMNKNSLKSKKICVMSLMFNRIPNQEFNRSPIRDQTQAYRSESAES